jgi:hypothetical protein
MTPRTSGLAARTVVRKIGKTPWIIDEEMPIAKLAAPRAAMFRWRPELKADGSAGIARTGGGEANPDRPAGGRLDVNQELVRRTRVAS